MNGLLQYRILSGNIASAFYLDSTTGELMQRAFFDRETVGRYDLEIEVSDSGLNVTRTTDVRLTVLIMDLNDNTPEISPLSAEGEVIETTTVGTALLTFLVRDLDSSQNAQLTLEVNSSVFGVRPNNVSGNFIVYKVTEVFDYFGFDWNSFVANTAVQIEFYLNQPLDYETTRRYMVVLSVLDQGSVPQSTSALIEIAVTDANDNPTNVDVDPTPLHYCEDQSPAPIFRGNISDLDTLDYYGLSVRVINGSVYDVLDVDLTGIAALKYFNPLARILSVIGSLPPYVYQNILSLVLYENTAKELLGDKRYFDIYIESDTIPNLPIPMPNSTNNTTNSSILQDTELATIFLNLESNASYFLRLQSASTRI